ncbi:unnamed protein product [Brachionus calyciflorus]|uniref:Uncharacterized protein n=1 Tax=Brachionus calyciflorus TaxID=104777 RepID=A0A814IEX8_9BILA|nr:unnamed protein product [Brachionus calyciflorus]
MSLISEDESSDSDQPNIVLKDQSSIVKTISSSSRCIIKNAYFKENCSEIHPDSYFYLSNKANSKVESLKGNPINLINMDKSSTLGKIREDHSSLINNENSRNKSLLISSDDKEGQTYYF